MSFASLFLKPELLTNLDTLGYAEMTEIQAQSLPPLLDGKDVIAQAKTGSGKTAAFGLALLQHLDVKQFRVQSVVLCPTRELADQVAKEIRRLGRGIHNIKVLTLTGGAPFGPQKGSLEHGAHIIVGTPGRVEEHLRKENLSLEHCRNFVLDEADRMLDMGFQEALDAIAGYLPEKRQHMLFSATFPDNIESLAARLMTQPVRIEVDAKESHSQIEERFYEIADNDARLDATELLLKTYPAPSCVVFCNTRIETENIAKSLRQRGFSALPLHGDLDQKDRDQILVRFANTSLHVLVATDVAARGIDIESVEVVINYQIARDLEVHTHRVGRTGRASNTGTAHTLFTPKEFFKLEKLEELTGMHYVCSELPEDSVLDQPCYQPGMTTLQINAGKKQKLRPGDILGALTRSNDIQGSDIGKIAMFPNVAFVAVHSDIAAQALQQLNEEKMKGRHFKVKKI